MMMMMIYLLTLLTIYRIQSKISTMIYNHTKKRVRTSGIGVRPPGFKWEKSKKVTSINQFGATQK